VAQMVKDEAKHAEMAMNNGGADLPQPIKNLMRATAKVMTSLSEKI